MKQIDELPADITLEDKDSIEAAREAYDSLEEEQKELVTNYEILEAAEKELAQIDAGKEDIDTGNEGNDNPSQIDSEPKTGDNNHLFFWIMLLALSCSGLIGMALYHLKQRKRTE